MSIEDPRLSSIDNTSAADDFDSAVEQHLGYASETVGGIEVAQAETPDATRTDRLPAETPPVEVAAATIPTEVKPNEQNVVTLPAGIELDNLEFEVDGENLVLVLADGTEIVVLGGAANIPTFVIGDVELPQVALFAALEGSNINVAAGPDGTFSAQGTPDGSRNFNDDPIEAGPEEFALTDLLGDTSFEDELQTVATFGGDGQPSITALEGSFIYDEAVIAGGDGQKIITGTLPFDPGPDSGAISAIGFVGASDVDEGDGLKVLTGFTSGGRPITVTSVPAVDTGPDFLALQGRDSAGGLVFTISVDRASGDFTFELFGKLEHPDAGQNGSQDNLEDLLRLSFTYRVTDLDGDFADGTFNIDVQDDAVSFVPAEDGAVDEDYLENGNVDDGDLGDDDDMPPVEQQVVKTAISAELSSKSSDTGSLGIRWGADDGNAGGNAGLTGTVNDRGVAFTAASVEALEEQNLKADGVELAYVLTNNGTTLIAYKPFGKPDGGEEGPIDAARAAAAGSDESKYDVPGKPVFIVNLSDAGTGSYTFDLVGAIDHPDKTTKDTFAIKLLFTAQDSDGDTASSIFTVNVIDDAPTVGTNTLVQLDDDALPNGIADGNADDAETATLTGMLAHSGGADGTASVLWASNGVTVPSGFLATSSADGTVMTITQTQDGQSVAVVQVTITDTLTGAYTIKQLAPVKHPQGTIPGTEDNVAFTVSYNVTDKDGDVATGTFSLNVDDDTPTVGTNTLVQLDDDALPNGIADGNADDAETATLTGMLAHSGGADGTASVLWASNGVTVPSGFLATSSADGTVMTITQTQDGQSVAVVQVTITDTLTGAYTIKQLAPVKHPQGTIPGTEDNVAFTVSYNVTDKDGDVATGTFSLNVDDDAPTVGTNTLVQLDDDALPNGIADGNADDAETATLTGMLAHSGGADGTASVLWASNGVTVPSGFLATSSADGTVMTITQTQDGQSVAVVQVTITDTLTGAYTIKQLAPVKHPQGTIPGTEDNVAFTVSYNVTDKDGDVATGTFSLNVDDDTPVAKNVEVARQLDDEAQAVFKGNDGANWPFGGSDVSTNRSSVSGNAGTLFSAGADGLKSVSIVGPAFAVVFKDAEGFAQTEEVEWVSGAPGEDGSSIFVAISENYGAPEGAAVLRIGPDGSYTFTMKAPLAHPEQKPLASGFEEEQTLRFEFTVVDGDGDTSSGSLSVKVDDDTPEPLVDLTITAALDDEAQTEFTPVNPGGSRDVPDDIKTVSGGKGSLFKMGADGLSEISVGLPAFSVLGRDDDGFAVEQSANWGEGVRSAGGVTTFKATVGSGEDIKVVAELIIRADGSYKFTLNAPVGHSVSSVREDNTELVFTYTVTDGDGDKAVGAVVISVDDDTPVAKTVVNATEVLQDPNTPLTSTTTGLAGALFTAGADGVQSVSISGGAFEVFYKQADVTLSEAVEWGEGTKSEDGATTFVATGAVSGQQAAVLKINVDGSYSFELKAPIVHTGGNAGEKTISIGFEVIDGDGDKDGGQLSLTVRDGAPTATPSTTVWLDDEDLADGNLGGLGDYPGTPVNPINTVNFSFGADKVGASISWLASSFVHSPAQGFTFEVEDSGKTLLVKQFGALVYTAVIDQETGKYAITQTGVVKHPAGSNENDVVFQLMYEVKDSDGDTAQSYLWVKVDDDTPIANDVVVTSGGLNDGSGAQANGVAGALFSAGADGLKSVSISGGAFEVYYKQAGVSVSEAVKWGEGNKSETGTTTFVAKGAVSGQEAAVLKINADGSYSFELKAPIVHTGESAGDKTISIGFEVIDGDGDKDAGQLSLTVTDGVPTARPSTTVWLDDENLEGGNLGGIGDYENTPENASGTVNFSFGADKVGASISWLASSFVHANAKGFTFEVEDGGKTLFVKQFGALVYTAVIDQETGKYAITQNGVVKHPAGSNENDVVFQLMYEVKDGDGDTAQSYLWVRVDDDTPIANDVVVTSSGLNDGSGAQANGVAGALFSAGADGLKSVSISGGAFEVYYKQAGVSVSEAVKWGEGNKSETGTTTFVAKGAVSGQEAAVLKINADGSYSFELKAPIVHTGESAGDKTISIGFEVIDGDGDKDAGQLSLTVTDGVPTARPSTTVWLDDENLEGGNLGGIGDYENTPENASGTVNFSFGADKVGASISWLASSFVHANAKGFTFEVEDGGKTLFVKQFGALVYTAVIDQETGKYAITQNGVVQHPAGSNENDVVFQLMYEVKDGDGDTAQSYLWVRVDDDTPIANEMVVVSATFDDELGTQATGETGALFRAGADGLKSVSISGGAFSVRYMQSPGEVSLVEAVVWDVVAPSENGVTTFLATGEQSGQHAAVLKIFEDGSYTFELMAPVANEANDYEPIRIGFEVVDGDGDTAKGMLEITVEQEPTPELSRLDFTEDGAEFFLLDFGPEDIAPMFVSDSTEGITLFGTDQDDVLHGGMGQVVTTGGEGADTFVFDKTALDEMDVADVITDYNAEDGDVLDVTALLDSLLGEQLTAETAGSHMRAAVVDGNTTVSVQTADHGWKDVVVLQNHDTAVKILFDDKHAAVTLD